MNIKDITVGIVTFRSEKVIFKCLKSLENIKKITTHSSNYFIYHMLETINRISILHILKSPNHTLSFQLAWFARN